MDRRPKVFVTQENPKVSYETAEQYGDVEFLAVNDLSSIANSPSNQRTISEIRRRLSDFNPESDYIVFTGSPTVAAAAFMILGEKTSKFNILRWSNQRQNYTPITINVAQ